MRMPLLCWMSASVSPLIKAQGMPLRRMTTWRKLMPHGKPIVGPPRHSDEVMGQRMAHCAAHGQRALKQSTRASGSSASHFFSVPASSRGDPIITDPAIPFSPANGAKLFCGALPISSVCVRVLCRREKGAATMGGDADVGPRVTSLSAGTCCVVKPQVGCPQVRLGNWGPMKSQLSLLPHKTARGHYDNERDEP